MKLTTGVLATLCLLALAAAPASARAAALIEGSWTYQGGVILVAPAPGGGFTGTVTKTGTNQCAGAPGETVWRNIAATQDPQRFTGEHSWVQAASCDLVGYFPATFTVGSLGQSMEVCTTNPDAGEVCRTYERSTTAPVTINCDGAAAPYSEQRIGNAVAAGCWETVAPGRLATSRTARVGGFTVTPQGASDRLEIDTGAGRLKATGGMRASIDGPGGALPDFDPAQLPVGRREASLPRGALRSLAGLPFAAEARVEWTGAGQGAKVTGGVSWANLPGALRDKVARRLGVGKLPTGDGAVTVALDNRTGFSVQGVEAKLADLAFPTPVVPLMLKSVSARLEQPDPNAPALRWRFEGQLQTAAGCTRRPARTSPASR